MRWGRSTTRDLPRASSPRRARLRAVATPCVIAVVAAFMVGDRQLPVPTILAGGPASTAPAAPTAPVSVPPGLHVPGSRDVRSPASVSPSDALPAGLGRQAVPDAAMTAYQ